jgi:hypothetical protein
MVNVCCCLEVCCRGRSLIAGSIAIAILELCGAFFEIIWPVLLITGAVNGLKAEISGEDEGKSRSAALAPPERVVVFEARMLYGEKMYILGSEPVDPKQRGLGDQAIKLDSYRVGMTEHELKQMSQLTVFYPLALCLVLVLAATSLILAARKSSTILALISFLLHAVATLSLFGYIIYICILINRMMDSLKTWQTSISPSRADDSFERFSLTWPLWLQLLHIGFIPFTFYGLVCSLNILLLHRGEKKTPEATFDWESSRGTFSEPSNDPEYPNGQTQPGE